MRKLWGFYDPNFILIETREPIKQPWEIELLRHQEQHQIPLQLEWHTKPFFAYFKKDTANKIALSIRPTLFMLHAIIAVILGLFHNLKYWLWWVFAILDLIPLVIFTYYTVSQIINEIRVKRHERTITDTHSVEVRDGPPGSGKTSSLLNDYKILADFMWKKICQKYKIYKPYLHEIPYWPKKDRDHANEIIEAYEFYKDGKTYPCLWTSVPGFVDGIPTNKITADHLMQRKRLPYGSVALLDETSLILPQELFRDKPYEIIEMFKFPRHFGDFHFGSTEQDEDSNVVYLRRVAGSTKHMLGQRWINQPFFLQWIYDRLTARTPIESMTKFKSNFFVIFEKIICAMGYRQYFYYENVNDILKTNGVQNFILKPYLNVDYDDRAYANAYRCIDKPLEQSKWDHKRLSKKEINEIFTEELKARGKTKEQIKREATEKRLANKSKEVKT